MAGVKDIINFLIPVPPIILIKNGDLPSCALVFEKISNNPPNARSLGRLFSWLCSMSFFSWLIWSVNALIFSSTLIVYLYTWGKNISMTTPCYFNMFSCQMIVAVFAAVLFFGQLLFYIIAGITQQISERCLEHVSDISSENSDNARKR